MWTFIKRLAGRSEPPAGNVLPRLLDLSPARRVLVVAPHPDDETMGCGGTLALLAPRCEIQVVLVTNGDGAGALPPGTSDIRKAEMRAALDVLGVTSPLVCFDEPDGRFEDSPGFQARFAAEVERFQPNWVFLPWVLDSHSDHSRIARACCKTLGRSAVESVLFYEIWTPVPATHVVDITTQGERVREALECHVTALAHGNYVHANMGLCAYRSILVPDRNARWAEAFTVMTPAAAARL